MTLSRQYEITYIDFWARGSPDYEYHIDYLTSGGIQTWFDANMHHPYGDDFVEVFVSAILV